MHFCDNHQTICNTVWKFQNFAITQILCEINFGDSTSAKSALLTYLDVHNFAFCEIWHFLKTEICKITKFRASQNTKTAVLELLDSPKLISRKI